MYICGEHVHNVVFWNQAYAETRSSSTLKSFFIHVYIEAEKSIILLITLKLHVNAVRMYKDYDYVLRRASHKFGINSFCTQWHKHEEDNPTFIVSNTIYGPQYVEISKSKHHRQYFSYFSSWQYAIWKSVASLVICVGLTKCFYLNHYTVSYK